MARAGGGNVFKSASTGVLRPIGVRGLDKGHANDDDRDPLLAVLNHSWNKSANHEDDHGKKRTGIATRSRGLMETGADKSAATKDKGKADEGRSRLGAAPTGGLLVDTAKSRIAFAGTVEDDAPGGSGESPPISPGDATKTPGGRRAAKAAAAPVRRYVNDVCPESVVSPRLMPPPKVRKGQCKLDFEHGAEDADAEHAQAEVDDHLVHCDKEQEHFIDLVHHFQGAVNQAGMRLNQNLSKVRKHFMEDESWLENKLNYDQITEVSFEVQTCCYYIAKWHNQLEPRKVPVPTRPVKIDDMSADDILAQTLYSVSRMEVLAAKLGPVLEKIVHESRTVRRGANGEALDPNDKNALLLAKKRGFQDVEDFGKLIGHLEHILATMQHLATPPTSGLPSMKNAAVVMTAVNAFKRGLTSPKSGAAGSGKTFANASSLLGAAIGAKMQQAPAAEAPAAEEKAVEG